MALTVRWLAKGNDSSRVVVCTGERMEPLVHKLYRSLGLRTTDYVPVHTGLSNDFLCHANIECAEWKWKAEEQGEGEGD